jgi:hypothetical protein
MTQRSEGADKREPSARQAAALRRGESPRKTHERKGGLSAMAKKAAKGGKKKGGKKR